MAGTGSSSWVRKSGNNFSSKVQYEDNKQGGNVWYKVGVTCTEYTVSNYIGYIHSHSYLIILSIYGADSLHTLHMWVEEQLWHTQLSCFKKTTCSFFSLFFYLQGFVIVELCDCIGLGWVGAGLWLHGSVIEESCDCQDMGLKSYSMWLDASLDAGSRG